MSTGFSFAAPSGAPSQFTFGAATAPAAASGALNQVTVGASSSSVTFQFGPVTSATTATSSQGASTTTPAASPFSFPVNTVAPAKTTAAAPFSFMANAAAPVTTPAANLTFCSSTVTTASTGAAPATFQFAPSGGDSKPSVPSGSASLFQFGPSATPAITQSTQQTFSITSTPASSTAETVKPFSFNASNTAQGFSFAAAKPQELTTGAPASFSFDRLAPKPETTFPAFGAAQPSSNQQSSATVSILNLNALLIRHVFSPVVVYSS